MTATVEIRSMTLRFPVEIKPENIIDGDRITVVNTLSEAIRAEAVKQFAKWLDKQITVDGSQGLRLTLDFKL